VDPPVKQEAGKSFDPLMPDPTPVAEVLLPTDSAKRLSLEQTPRSPSLDEMVANTLEPMIKTTGNDLDLTRWKFRKKFTSVIYRRNKIV
jgi:hypothetical protein